MEIKKIFAIGSFFWFLLVYGFYSYYHGLSILLSLLLLLYIVFFALSIFFRKSLSLLSSSFSEIRIQNIFFRDVLFLFFLLVSLIGFAYFEGGFVDWLFIESLLGIRVLFLVVFFFILASWGKRMLSWFHVRFSRKADDILFSFGTGVIFFIFLSFLLGIFKGLYFFVELPLVLIILFLSRKEIKENILFFWRLRFPVAHLKKISYEKGLLLILFFLFLAGSFLLSQYRYPFDIDDLIAYFSVAQLYENAHGWVSLENSTPAMTGGLVLFFYSFIGILTSSFFDISLSWMFFVLLMYSLYRFGEEFFSREAGLFTVLFLSLAPFNIYFLSSQKVIYIFSYLSSLAVFSFFSWIKTQETRWIILCSMFLGFSVNVKMNGLLLAASLFLIVLLWFFVRRISFRQFSFFLFFLIVFSSPIFIYNASLYNSPIAPFSLSFFFSKKESGLWDNKETTQWKVGLGQYDPVLSKTIDRIIRPNSLIVNNGKSFLQKVWDFTVYPTDKHYFNENIGPFLLIFLTLFIIVFFTQRLYRNRYTAHLMLLCFLFSVVWYFFGTGRVWYAAAMLYFFSLLCSLAFLHIFQEGLQRVILIFLIVFFVYILNVLFFRITETPNIFHVDEGNSFQECQKSLKDKVFEDSENPRALFLGDPRTAYLDKWNEWVIVDVWGMDWIKMVSEKETSQEIIAMLQENKITHIVVSEILESLKAVFSLNDEGSMLLRNLKKFEILKEEHLTGKGCCGGTCVFQIRYE